MKYFKYLVIILLLFTSCSNNVDEINIKLIPVVSDKLYQFIGIDGKILINPQFSNVSIFREDVALVKTNEINPKYGFISNNGKYIVNPIFKEATIFNEGLAWVVSENSPPVAINKKGKKKIVLKNAIEVKIFSEGLSAFSISSSDGIRWGFINKKGKIIIPPQFYDVNIFKENKCAVKNKNNKWGFIDMNGNLLIDYQFDNVSEGFSGGEAVVYLFNKAGVIDENGKFIINPQFSQITIDGNIYLVELNEKFGWCDKNGHFIIYPQFLSAFPFYYNSMTPVETENGWGYIDTDGIIKINIQYEMAFPFNNYIAAVIVNDKLGFIDLAGRCIINPQFDFIAFDMYKYLKEKTTKFESVESDLRTTIEDNHFDD